MTDKVIPSNELRNRGKRVDPHKQPTEPASIGAGPDDQGPKRSQKQTGQSLSDPQDGDKGDGDQDGDQDGAEKGG